MSATPKGFLLRCRQNINRRQLTVQGTHGPGVLANRTQTLYMYAGSETTRMNIYRLDKGKKHAGIPTEKAHVAKKCTWGQLAKHSLSWKVCVEGVERVPGARPGSNRGGA